MLDIHYPLTDKVFDAYHLRGHCYEVLLILLISQASLSYLTLPYRTLPELILLYRDTKAMKIRILVLYRPLLISTLGGI